MRTWLIGLAGLAGVATPLHAEERIALRILTDTPPPRSHPTFRIGEEQQVPLMLPRLGLVAETQVLPNTRIGVGLVPISKSNPAADWQSPKRSNSRKPGISLRFRF